MCGQSSAGTGDGCGSGYLSAELARRSKRVIGTDFSERFVALCRRKYRAVDNIEFVESDVTAALPLESGSVDVVLCKMVLQYVAQIDTFAKESWRALKPRGFVLLVVDHPFLAQFSYAQQVAGRPDPKYPDLTDYFASREHTKRSLWGKVDLILAPKSGK